MRMFDTAGYLRRLHLNDPGEPTVAALQILHKAHVERVAYEALDIQLQRPTSLDPYESAERIVHDHRGGYCYHLNGAFSLLLRALGYDVVWHRAGVQNHTDAAPPGADRANHLALTIHGLESEVCPSGIWLVDVGLGDALHEPIPLHEGTYVQGPFRYHLRRSAVEPAGWRLDHDPLGSFAGMEFGIIAGVNPPDPAAGTPSYDSFEPARYAMGDTLRYARRMNLLAMEPYGDLSSTGYVLANLSQEYIVLQPSETMVQRQSPRDPRGRHSDG